MIMNTQKEAFERFSCVGCLFHLLFIVVVVVIIPVRNKEQGPLHVIYMSYHVSYYTPQTC